MIKEKKEIPPFPQQNLPRSFTQQKAFSDVPTPGLFLLTWTSMYDDQKQADCEPT